MGAELSTVSVATGATQAEISFWSEEENTWSKMPALQEGPQLTQWDESFGIGSSNELYSNRRGISQAVGLMHGRLPGDTAYSAAAQHAEFIEMAFANPNDPISVAAKSLREQIVSRRQLKFTLAVETLNGHIAADPAQLWVKFLGDNMIHLYAKLDSLYLGMNDKAEPTPKPIVVGKNNAKGPAVNFHPFGLFIECENRI